MQFATMDTMVKINSAFMDYLFYEEEHYYTYKGNRVKTSVTQFIDTKHKPFDREGVSDYVARRDGKSQKEILDQWDRLSRVACDTGTLVHLHAEHLANRKMLEITFDNIGMDIRADVINRVNKLIPMVNKFFDDMHGNLIPIKTEFTVGYKDIIAGNIDLLCWNVEAQEFQIWDYKTNKDIKTSNLYEKLLEEFSELDNCEFNKYSIQLGIYKHLLELNCDIKIGKRYLVWLNENNPDYIIYECKDLDATVKKAIDNLIEGE